jgi:hypothetical protein
MSALRRVVREVREDLAAALERDPAARAVGRVEMLSEVAEWAREMHRAGVKAQYVVRLDEPVRRAGKCYWPVEVRGDGKLWRRYLISPDGKSIRPND